VAISFGYLPASRWPRITTIAQRTPRGRLLKQFAVAAFFAALWPVAGASSAVASVTIGQLDPAPGGIFCPAPAKDYVQPTVTSGNSYVVPGTGTITSWSHNAQSGSGQTLTMKIFRKVADPATYMVVAHDGPRNLAQGTLNGFPASIPVKPGDVLGLNSQSPVDTACAFLALGESPLQRTGNMVDGEVEPFNSGSDTRPNISAVFVYSNAFTLGATAANKKNGTATITINLPNPGELTASGNGVRVASGRGAEISKSVPAGPAQLQIKAKGKKKKTLNDTGKVKLRLAITYTPTGGDASTQSLKVKLRKH